MRGTDAQPAAQRSQNPDEKSLLQQFLDARKIPSARIERAAIPPINRRSMARWRETLRPNITLSESIRLLRAIRAVTGERVQLHEILPVEPDDWP